MMVLDVEEFAAGGKALARVDNRVVFLPLVVPGDRVHAKVTKVRKKFVEAEPIEILVPAATRVEPKCRHFRWCGGCKWQHASYPAQLRFKQREVADALERIGDFQGLTVLDTIGSDDEYFYRNKMEFSFGAAWFSPEEYNRNDRGREVKEKEVLALGLHPPKTFFKIIDIGECWLQSETSNRIIDLVRRFAQERSLTWYSTRTHTGYLRNLVIREGRRTGDLMVNLVTSEDRPGLLSELSGVLTTAVPSITTVVNNITTRKSQVAIGDTERIYHGPGFITERIGTRVFRISANSFFQTNTAQAEKLYEVVRSAAEFRPEDVVFDLYCGTGSIALFVADGVRSVTGVETVESAVLDARNNAALNGVTNCRFEIGDLKEKLMKDRDWLASSERPTVVIVDPPRSGLHPDVAAAIPALGARRIVYVSCNPATQARDLKILCEGTGYSINTVQPVDMFPHTDHIECVVALSSV